MSQSVQKIWPFCPVEDAGVGAGTLHPVALSLDKAIEWYRMIKLWDLVIVTAWNTYTWNGLQWGYLGTVAASEHDLACFPQDSGNNGNDWNLRDFVIETPPPDNITAWDMFLFTEWGIPQSGGGINAAATPGSPFITDSMRYDAGSYYPQFLFRMGADYSGVTSSEEDVSTYNDGTATPAAVTLTVDGYSIPLYTYSSPNIISITLTPSEWWPYAPTSGGDAILDSATGTQISDNVVVD